MCITCDHQVCTIVPGQRVKKLDPQQASQVGRDDGKQQSLASAARHASSCLADVSLCCVQMPKLVRSCDPLGQLAP